MPFHDPEAISGFSFSLKAERSVLEAMGTGAELQAASQMDLHGSFRVLGRKRHRRMLEVRPPGQRSFAGERTHC